MARGGRSRWIVGLIGGALVGLITLLDGVQTLAGALRSVAGWLGDLPVLARVVVVVVLVLALVLAGWWQVRTTLLGGEWERVRSWLRELQEGQEPPPHLVAPKLTASWADVDPARAVDQILGRLAAGTAVVVHGSVGEGKTILTSAVSAEAARRMLAQPQGRSQIPLRVEASELAALVPLADREGNDQVGPADLARGLVQAVAARSQLPMHPRIVGAWWEAHRILVVVDGVRSLDPKVGGVVEVAALRRAIEALLSGPVLIACRDDFWEAFADSRPTSAPPVSTVRVARADLQAGELAALKAQLADRRERLSQQPPAGTGPGEGRHRHAIRLVNFFGGGDRDLFIEPTAELSWRPTAGRSIIDEVVGRLAAGEPTVLVGDPGQGKTLILQIIFDRLARRFCEDGGAQRPQLPLLVVLASLSDALTAVDDPGVDMEGRILKAAARLNGLDLPTELLVDWWRSGRLVLLLDGLDELSSTSGGSDPIGSLPAAVQGMLVGPTVLSTRRAFWEVYREDNEALAESLGTAMVNDIDFERYGERFIRAYCSYFPNLDTAAQVAELIRGTPGLADLAKRPLTLFMVTDVLAHEPELVVKLHSSVEGGKATLVGVYAIYIDKWLRIESKRSQVLAFEERKELARLMAWRMFEINFAHLEDQGHGHANLATIEIGAAALAAVVTEWVRDHHPSSRASEIFEDLTSHNLLIRSGGQGSEAMSQVYRFAHKSFFEYLVAIHLWTQLQIQRDLAELVELLESPLPDEVIGFVRQVLLSSTPEQETIQAQVRAAFWKVIETTDLQGDGGVMARQQAANLLPAAVVRDPRFRGRIRGWYASEPDIFVKRGIAVGFALHLEDPELLDEFVGVMWQDEAAMSVHLGYNRVYYGDQPQHAGWTDDGGPMSPRLFDASKRHLRSPLYRYHWAMSAATIEALLRDPRRRSHLALTAADRADLRALVAKLDDRPVEIRARRRLEAVLDALDRGSADLSGVVEPLDHAVGEPGVGRDEAPGRS